MVQFVGKYQYESGENFDEFLRELGVGFILRNLAKTSKPTIEITLDGDVYTIKTITTLKTSEIKFKLVSYCLIWFQRLLLVVLSRVVCVSFPSGMKRHTIGSKILNF